MSGGCKGTDMASTQLLCHCWVGGLLGATLLPSLYKLYSFYNKWTCPISLSRLDLQLKNTMASHPRGVGLGRVSGLLAGNSPETFSHYIICEFTHILVNLVKNIDFSFQVTP